LIYEKLIALDCPNQTVDLTSNQPTNSDNGTFKSATWM